MKVVSKEEAITTGAPRYFTGQPCQAGHLAERYASNGHCIECHRLNYETTKGSSISRQEVAKFKEEVAGQFWSYCRACLRFDVQSGHFEVWDRGQWRLDYRDGRGVRELFRDFLASKIAYLQAEQQKAMAARNQPLLSWITEELLALEGWREQRSLPRFVLVFLYQKCCQSAMAAPATTPPPGPFDTEAPARQNGPIGAQETNRMSEQECWTVCPKPGSTRPPLS